MIKSLTSLAETGRVTITGDKDWYTVIYTDDAEGLEIRSDMPTLQQAIASIETQIGMYWTKVNIDNLWKGS